MPRPAIIQRLTSDFRGRSPKRTTSLIVTLLGDVVTPHGGTIWLGSLVRALDAFGISERLVRTSVFRLVRDGWLESERVGRRSYYRFSDYGSHEFARAARRVYALEQEPWHGRWQLLIPLHVPDDHRLQFKRSLHWQGFRNIAAGIFARPGDSDRTLLETLNEFDAMNRVLVMEADTIPLTSFHVVRAMVHDHWKQDEVAQDYRQFISRFNPLWKFLQRNPQLDPESAFIARTLLIHDYRRVLLRDTPLPEELLPPAWLGGEARKLTSQLYALLAESSMVYITTQLEAGNGPMPSARESFAERFAPTNGASGGNRETRLDVPAESS